MDGCEASFLSSDAAQGLRVHTRARVRPPVQFWLQGTLTLRRHFSGQGFVGERVWEAAHSLGRSRRRASTVTGPGGCAHQRGAEVHSLRFSNTLFPQKQPRHSRGSEFTGGRCGSHGCAPAVAEALGG